MSKKRSERVNLFLVGAASILITGCNEPTEYTYANKEDCVSEWQETECHSVSSNAHGAGYYTIQERDTRTPSKATSIANVKRGGFGSFFRSIGG